MRMNSTLHKRSSTSSFCENLACSYPNASLRCIQINANHKMIRSHHKESDQVIYTEICFVISIM